MIKKICFILAILPSLLVGQHSIKGNFSPAEDFNFAILYKVTPETSVYINNTEIDDQGNFEFQLDSTATKGMYRIVYAVPQEEYNFDMIYNTQEDIELTFNMTEGVVYKASKENILWSSYTKNLDLVHTNIRQFFNQKNPNKSDFLSVFKILKDTQEEFESASKNTIALEFIKASRPYIPESYEDAETFSKQLKATYFNHIDYSNDVLQSSNFLIESTLNYVFAFVNPSNADSDYKNNIDTIIQQIGDEPVIKDIILKVLWNQFVDIQNEPVANYITTQYLLNIAKTNKDEALIEMLTTFKKNSIGEVASDFVLDVKNESGSAESKKLSQLHASENYLIVFWSSTCSHCLEELPKLKTFAEVLTKEKLQVIAIGLEDEPYRWKDKTYDFPDFIHVYGEGKWENKIGNAYAVSATPSYYLLDKNKKIVAKPFDFDALKEIYNKKPAKPIFTDVKPSGESQPLIED